MRIAIPKGTGSGPVSDQPPPTTVSLPSDTCAKSARSMVTRTSRVSHSPAPACAEAGLEAPSGGDALDVRRGDQLGGDAGEAVQERLVGVQESPVGLRDGQLDVEHPGSHHAEHLLQLALRPHRAERARARTDHRHRLPADRRLGDRARDPVERVLQGARDRAVVLGCRDEDRVRLSDRGLQAIDRVGCEILEVLVERRDLGETVEDDELDALGQLLRGEAEELRVVRACAEAAGDAEDRHYDSLPCCTKKSVAFRSTSSASIEPPSGSGAFHVRPTAFLSTEPSSESPSLRLPHGSATGSVIVPVRVMGARLPLISSVPSTVTSLPSRVIVPASKESSGYAAASKKSGDARCSASWSLSTSMLETCAVPLRPVSSRLASKVRNAPENGATPM